MSSRAENRDLCCRIYAAPHDPTLVYTNLTGDRLDLLVINVIRCVFFWASSNP